MFTSTIFRTFVLCLVTIAFSSAVHAQTEPRDLGFEAYQQENYEDAVKHLREAVAKDENDLSSWRYLGMAYLYLKNNRDSRRSFQASDKIGKNATRYEPKITKDVRITARSHPTSPQALRQPFSTQPDDSPRDGVARLLVEYRKDGQIGMIHIISNTVPAWRDELIRTAKRMKFEPAEMDGKPITVLNMVEYSYTS